MKIFFAIILALCLVNTANAQGCYGYQAGYGCIGMVPVQTYGGCVGYQAGAGYVGYQAGCVGFQAGIPVIPVQQQYVTFPAYTYPVASFNNQVGIQVGGYRAGFQFGFYRRGY